VFEDLPVAIQAQCPDRLPRVFRLVVADEGPREECLNFGAVHGNLNYSIELLASPVCRI
jgi:hypothetical protein